MFYIYAFLAPAVVLLLAAGLVVSHLRAWRAAQRENLDVEFSRGQFRRRMQTSVMLAVLAVGLCVGQLIRSESHPTFFVLFWLGMVLLIAWMVLLALGDLILGRHYVARLQRERRVAEAQLQAELDRIRNRLAQENENQGPQHSA